MQVRESLETLESGLRSYFAALVLCASEISAHEVNPNILSTTGLKFEGLVFATAGSSCIAPLGWLLLSRVTRAGSVL